jgi:hypothetical protein
MHARTTQRPHASHGRTAQLIYEDAAERYAGPQGRALCLRHGLYQNDIGCQYRCMLAGLYLYIVGIFLE